MFNKPHKGQGGWSLVLRRGLLVACLWCAAVPVGGAVGVPQSREAVGGRGVARVQLAARRQPAVYVPAVPACGACPAVLRPEDELKIVFQVFGRKGQPTRLRAYG